MKLTTALIEGELSDRDIRTISAFQLFLGRGLEPPIRPLDMVSLTPEERALLVPWARNLDQLCDYAEPMGG